MTRAKLPILKGVKLALDKEQNKVAHCITDSVRVSVELEDGTWPVSPHSLLHTLISFSSTPALDTVTFLSSQARTCSYCVSVTKQNLFNEPHSSPIMEETGLNQEEATWTVAAKELPRICALKLEREAQELKGTTQGMSTLFSSLRLKSPSIAYLLSDPRATRATLRFLADSGRFDSLYCPPSEDPLP